MLDIKGHITLQKRNSEQSKEGFIDDKVCYSSGKYELMRIIKSKEELWDFAKMSVG